MHVVTEARTALGDFDLYGINHRSVRVRWFLPAFSIERLNEIGHAVFNGKNHFLKILSLHHDHEDAVNQNEVCAFLPIGNDIQQQIVSGRMRHRCAATNPQTADFVFRPESYRRVLGNSDAVDSLLGNLQAKFFCQNSGETNEWAAKLLGERWMHVTSTNVGRSDSSADNQSASSGVTRSEQRRYFVEPSRFTTLKRGGAHHGFQVESIVYNGGHRFPSGAESLPYKLITFNQK